MSSEMKELRAEINTLLRERRPDRYTVGGGDEDSEKWLLRIAEEIEPLIPEIEAKAVLARTLVRQEEGKATRRGNQFFRYYALTGQLPLFWAEDGAWPISVIGTDPDDPSKKIEERVALRAATRTDARAFANEERRRAAGDFASRNAACVGAEMIADGTEAAGLYLIWDWIQTLNPPDDPS